MQDGGLCLHRSNNFIRFSPLKVNLSGKCRKCRTSISSQQQKPWAFSFLILEKYTWKVTAAWKASLCGFQNGVNRKCLNSKTQMKIVKSILFFIFYFCTNIITVKYLKAPRMFLAACYNVEHGSTLVVVIGKISLEKSKSWTARLCGWVVPVIS